MEARKGTVAQISQKKSVESREDGAEQLAMSAARPQALMLIARHYSGIARDIAEHDRSQLAP